VTESWLEPVLIRLLRGMDAQPDGLVVRLEFEAKLAHEAFDESILAGAIESLGNDSGAMRQLGFALSRWDLTTTDAAWTGGTEPSSPERRQRIHTLLGMPPAVAAVIDGRRPVVRSSATVVAAEQPWDPWYTTERAAEREFYWPRYRQYLLDLKRWHPDTVAKLDAASTDIVSRLADPCRSERYQSKGLVVGYVQSGKTANFTGVIAKAFDAGYRLVIVMTGTIELLRAQTQRRIDMELVGRQNIVGSMTPQEAADAGIDYQDDPDWIAGRFNDLGVPQPSPGIHRFTLYNSDYTHQFLTLAPDHSDPAKPMWDPVNLFPARARLVVTKKNSKVLEKLVADLRLNRKAFEEIPVLIIDDESDLASPNTVDPAAAPKHGGSGKDEDDRERKAINAHIADMLRLMPRAQYVGYTATPFANVFVDPEDDAGIFPKDFVVGLDRPTDYMGVEDFHDLDGVDDPHDVKESNKAAHVRVLGAGPEDEEAQLGELAKALRMFVLAGAIKCFREARGAARFRHHTMLVHESVRMDDAKETKDRILELWRKCKFTQPAGVRALKELYEADVAIVSDARREAGTPIEASFDDLVPFIAEALSRIEAAGGDPVLIVNSDAAVQRSQAALDFDRTETWRVLVGGAKLSRGFTVEGLTVTYFRRATNLAAALTQMGRWFGFRSGYRDLVRLYIAQSAKLGGKTVDIYEAFEAVARDERAFREQLKRYAGFGPDGKPLLTPAQIPPLVFQHLPWLRPDAKNKMFNAVIVSQFLSPLNLVGISAGADAARDAVSAWTDVFACANDVVHLKQAARTTFEARHGVLSADGLLAAIAATPMSDRYRASAVTPILRFAQDAMAQGKVSDFLVVLPQPDTGVTRSIAGRDWSVVKRRRRDKRNVFGEITDPKHRAAIARFLAGAPDAALSGQYTPTRGALLLYVMRDEQDHEVPGVSIYLPTGAVPDKKEAVRFQVLVDSKKDAPTVDADEVPVSA
jgi:hypothetical protein